MPLAQVMMSGVTPKRFIANMSPIRPKAQMISSATSSTSYLSQISRTRWK